MRLYDADARPDSVLAAIADDLELLGVPLCREFVEMIKVHNAPDPLAVSPTIAAAEVLSEPATRAEATAAQVLYAVASYAYNNELDPATVSSLLERMVVYVARFESYLAERTARELWC